jgi:hypothetical protein
VDCERSFDGAKPFVEHDTIMVVNVESSRRINLFIVDIVMGVFGLGKSPQDPTVQLSERLPLRVVQGVDLNFFFAHVSRLAKLRWILGALSNYGSLRSILARVPGHHNRFGLTKLPEASSNRSSG